MVRRKKAAGKADAVRMFFEEHIGVSNRKAAKILGIPETTIRRLLKNSPEGTAPFTKSEKGKDCLPAPFTISGL